MSAGGTWLALVHGARGLTAADGFADQGDVLVKTRLAATAVGATPMDRPEWTAVDPRTGAVYCTLTNNTSSAKVINAANPRRPNPWGHIIRRTEAGGDHASSPSGGTCSCWRARAGMPRRRTAPRSPATTRSGRPTVCGWTTTAGCGSRPTARNPWGPTTRSWPWIRR